MKGEVQQIVNKISRKRIIVIGDAILDCYKHGAVKRLSPEAPIPVFNETSTEYKAGGAANVALNLVACEQDVILLTVVGDDQEGQILRQLLKNNGISDRFIIVDKSRRTTTKYRYYSGDKQLFRSDSEDEFDIACSLEQEISRGLSAVIDSGDIIVISDYAKGVVTDNLAQTIITSAHAKHKLVIADPKKNPYRKYSNCDIVKPNQSEFSLMLDREVVIEDLRSSCEIVCKRYQFGALVVTCGEVGLFFYENNNSCNLIPALKTNVHDVSGAGDTTIAYLAVGIASGVHLKNASILANFAAGLKVAKKGAVPVSLFEIIHFQNKVVHACELLALKRYLTGKKIVFTNGCFDIFHKGHVSNLRAAANCGDVLVVGINSDESVRKIKGNNRPIMDLDSRVDVLAACSFVDYIVPFDDETPLALIKTLLPDVLVKGEDYAGHEIAGATIVKENGGHVKTVPMIKGISTTEIIRRIKEPDE